MLSAQSAKEPARYGLPSQLRSGPELEHALKQRLVNGTIKHLVEHKLVRGLADLQLKACL